MKKNLKIQERHSERGGAGVKLLVFAVLLILVVNAAYQYIPTAYQGESFKQDMKAAVLQGTTIPSSAGTPIAVIKDKLFKAAKSNDLPYDVYVNVIENNNIITARVYYTKELQIIPFGIYNYEYVFDHTATPSGFTTE